MKRRAFLGAVAATPLAAALPAPAFASERVVQERLVAFDIETFYDGKAGMVLQMVDQDGHYRSEWVPFNAVA